MIDIKVVADHFVTCYPMPAPKEDEVTFPQNPRTPRSERKRRHRYSPYDGSGTISEYVRTHEDQTA